MTRRKTIHRDDILDAAEAVVREQGVQRFTLDAVAQRAGISKGGLVYSFNTKDDLIEAMLAREFSRFGADASNRSEKVKAQAIASCLATLRLFSVKKNRLQWKPLRS